MTQDAALTLTNARWSTADGKVVFDHLDLTVMVGEVTYIAGASKSGKTVICGVLTGLVTLTAGTIRWSDSAGPSDYVTRSYVPQTLGLLDDLSVQANITLPLSLAGTQEDRTWTSHLMNRLGIAHLVRRASNVSVGERQRVAIARALVSQPRVVIADEPTAHQDARNAINIFSLFHDLAALGSAVVVTGQQQAPSFVHHAMTLERSSLDGRPSDAGA